MKIDAIVPSVQSETFKRAVIRFFSQDRVFQVFAEVLKEHIVQSTAHDRHFYEMRSRFVLEQKKSV